MDRRYWENLEFLIFAAPILKAMIDVQEKDAHNLQFKTLEMMTVLKEKTFKATPAKSVIGLQEVASILQMQDISEADMENIEKRFVEIFHATRQTRGVTKVVLDQAPKSREKDDFFVHKKVLVLLRAIRDDSLCDN